MSKVCSRQATWQTASIARQSPRPGQDAWRRWTPSAGLKRENKPPGKQIPYPPGRLSQAPRSDPGGLPSAHVSGLDIGQLTDILDDRSTESRFGLKICRARKKTKGIS